MPRRPSGPIQPIAQWPCPYLISAAGLIAIATVIAYLPALRGGFIWDDDAHVTRPELRSVHGLHRIWFNVGATQQYYPLLHSAFWVENRLWGDWPVGYHAVNVGLHACAAVMVMLVMRRLLRARAVAWSDEGAFLTAAVFALHPVHVESVAWITEQKNTLSAVFYLAALLAYLRFDRTRRRGPYLLAAALFLLGLLTKTVIATLPAALLVVFWWQRGRLSWKRDAAPLLPWLLFGAIGGLFTAWVEHHLIGAKGQAFDLSAIQRVLLAGRVVWFYLFKLVWPAELIFVHPRWDVNPGAAWQWFFPVALVFLTTVLLVFSRRGRAPLAALLLLVGSLFPVLGLFNVYPFLFSFVADHFQYLPSLGVIALFCSAAAAGIARIRSQVARRLLFLSLPVVFGVLTFRQCRTYADAQTLYETTIRKNPECWMAYNNLGIVLKVQGRPQEAIEHYRRALELRPEYPEAYNNLGIALAAMGKYEEAIAAYRQTLRLRPANPETLSNLAAALSKTGRDQEAIDCLQRALQFEPNNARLHGNLGVVLQAAGRVAEAIAEYRRALELDPDQAGVRQQLELLLAAAQPAEQSIAAYEELLRAHPDNAQAHFELAVALVRIGRVGSAVEHYQQVVRIQPGNAEAHTNLAALLAQAGRVTEAIPHFEQAAQLRPEQVEMRMNLAVAYMSAGRFSDALASAQRGRELAGAAGDFALVEQIESWIASCRERASTSAPSP